MRLADRLLLISLSFMILAGCSSGTMDNIAGGTMAEFELTCSINNFEPTKASMSGLQMQWSEGDVIIISAGGKTYPFTTVSGGPVAVFKGRLPADSGQILARFEASVEAVQNGDPSAYIPCSASADLRVTKTLDFSPEVALVRIQVDREDIRYIQITGNGEIADGSKAVRRMPDSGRMLEPGNVYVVVRPEAEGQLTVVAVSDRGVYSISLSDISAGDCRVVSDAVSAWTNNVADGPARYIFIQTADWQYNSSLIAENFGPWDGKDLAVGEAAMFYIFERPITTLNAELRNHLEASQRSGVPIFVELDPITFWDDAPELWNWFDPSLPGYDPDMAVTVSQAKLDQFNVRHPVITGQQRHLYSEYAKTGKKLTLEDMRDIEIKAMTNAGVPASYAERAVNEAYYQLKKSGIEPVNIPWNKKKGT